uniref:Proteasome subunit beta type-3 n=1 Tax=Rattus norvegicus TaxID=10116 RepID=A0A8I5ZRG0_RAT
MVTTDFQKIFPMGDRLYIGLAGLATDVQTVVQRLKFRLNLYELKEMGSREERCLEAQGSTTLECSIEENLSEGRQKTKAHTQGRLILIVGRASALTRDPGLNKMKKAS